MREINVKNSIVVQMRIIMNNNNEISKYQNFSQITLQLLVLIYPA